ncbi:MAG TPA: cellulose binding domain-containing protein [Streptosporangiaceae bacterium]|nr:cellulose binding domain-containing protein [Streptosporangiaceae bacterium]
MHYRRPVIAATAALLLAFGGVVTGLVGVTTALAATTLCQSQTAGVSGGTYIVQNNEWNSSASECVTTDGNADFTVANSSISNSTSGAPGGYPSIYQGCHWGNCSSGGLSSNPIQVSNLTAGKVTTSWSTTQPGGSNDYDVAYDIWFNQTPTTNGQPNGTELMVWLNHNGPVQPFGSQVASNVSIGGHTYNIWFGTQSTWDTVSYTMTSPATSVSNLDIGALTQDMVSRGYTKSSWYLIDVEAGFELWQGGAGLATNSFSVSVNGGGGGNNVTMTNPGTQTGVVGTATSLQIQASDSAAGQTLTYSATGLPAGLSINSSTGLISGKPTTSGNSSVTVTAKDTTGASGSASFGWTVNPAVGGGSCHVTYTLNSSWPGGFSAQVTIANTGTTTINGWSLTFTFPGDEKITSDFNGSFSQAGANATLTNASYNGAITPGANITVGFQGTWTSSVANPTSFAINGTTCT